MTDLFIMPVQILKWRLFIMKKMLVGLIGTLNTFAIGAAAGLALVPLAPVLIPAAIVGTGLAWVGKDWLFSDDD